MRTRSLLGLLVITAAVVAAAAWMVTSRQTATAPGGTAPAPLFADLRDRINDVAVVEVRDAKGGFTMRRGDDERWVMVDKAGYPVRADAVKKMVVGLAGVERIEPRTAKPEYYDRLGVAAIDQPGSAAAQVTLKDAGGETLAALLVGKSEAAETPTEPARLFVRRPDQAQSWLASGRIEVKADPMTWLQPDLVKLQRSRIASVEIVQPGGETLRLVRSDPAKDDFTVADPPADRAVRTTEANATASAFEFMTFEDVVPAASVDLSGATVATFRTVDGLVITTRTVSRDGKPWVAFTAAYEPPPAAAGDADAKPDSAKADEVKAQADQITARLDGWVYRIPDYRAEHLTRTLEQVTEKEKPKDAS